MTKQVPWNKFILETFISEASLTKDEELVMRTRVAGWSKQEQAIKLGMSTSSIDRIIKSLKVKYDRLQKYDVMLPPRKKSAAETWMDEH